MAPESVKRRLRTRAAMREMADTLRECLPGVPLEFESITDAPVASEDGTLAIKTDGVAVLRVLAAAQALARDVGLRADALVIVPRVWPRTIWCRLSSRPAPRNPKPGTAPEVKQILSSARDARGNILLCVPGSHSGDHDFCE